MSAKQHKPSKTEIIAHSTVRSHKNLSSYEVVCRMEGVRGIVAETEREIHECQSRLTMLRARLAADNAVLSGLEEVLDSHNKTGD